MPSLTHLGFAEPFLSAFTLVQTPVLKPARVCAAHRGAYALLSELGHHPARLRGRMRHAAQDATDLPAVGDWVAAQGIDGDGSQAVIEHLLPRRSALVRARPAGSSEPQVIATNLDHVFVVSALDRDWNPRRLERYLALIWQSGAQPVVVLSKADLSPDAEGARDAAARVALGAPVHLICAPTQEGLSDLSTYLAPGNTVALVGSSGVGKSTLANVLLGDQVLATADIRASDGRGKHTTTRRELFCLPTGALLVDTPGMREVGLWDAADGLDTAFDDVEALVSGCRFSDCSHEGEPGCRVRQAIACGDLSEQRYRSYLKLQRELSHLERQRDERAQRAHQAEVRRIQKDRARKLRHHHKR